MAMIFAFKVSLVGIGVVFLALILIAGIIALLQRVAGESEPVPKPEVAEGISPEVVAVIADAATVALGKGARVKRVRYGRSTDSAWTGQGRVTIMASHITKP
jgi:Na+-transporting methylmalonyl-CoA/oxaloacetate decarboxylase gamma subunit